MGWTDPTDPTFFEISKHLGALCLIAVNEHIPSFATVQGTGPAVRAEVHVIDGAGAPAVYPDAMFFGKRIVPQLQRSVGSTILGRIGQGEKKAGQNAPYQLDKAGPGDGEKANAYVKANGDVESHPITQTVNQPSASDGEAWRVAGAQQQPATANGGGGPSLPPPPSYPTTYTQPANVGASAQDDEPPF